MKSVSVIKNQYFGVNAHMHSLFQAEGGWDEFHLYHITHLATALKAQLQPMGYTAAAQQALQIRRYGEPAGKPESDVLIYDADPLRQFQPYSTPMGAGGQLVMPVPELLNLKEQEVEQYRAIGIYRFTPGRRDRGEPVAWIELLSPSNKPGGQDYGLYHEKCLKIMQSGVVFVEIDYLHETPPTFEGIPNYVHRGDQDALPGSYPYHILVLDPRPDFISAAARIYLFGVDDPIPLVEIPLNDGEVLRFDFNAPYQRTFEESLFGSDIDYSQLPRNFDRYSRADQARIAARMVAVLEAAQAGADLESAPLPLKSMQLADALQRIEAFTRH